MKTLRVFIPLQQRKVYHPQWLKLRRVHQPHAAAHFQAQLAHLLAGLFFLTTQHQYQVARLCAQHFRPGCQIFLAIKLIYARLVAAVFIALHVHHAFGSNLRALHPVNQAIQLLARVVGLAFGTDAHHQLSTIKHLKALILRHGIQVGQFHPKAHVRLIYSVAGHGLIVGHVRKVWQVHIQRMLKQVLSQPLKGGQHFFLGHKGHFAVNLRKLRLAVSTQVFVPEALHYLEVAVVARHHQYLLKSLRALR